jgi:hypothetical protein
MEVGPLPGDDGPSVRLITVESFDMFFRREYPRLVTLAYALSGSRDLAEGAAQQAFGGCSYGGWCPLFSYSLYRRLDRCCFDRSHR